MEDVTRLDRLITDISDASRLDAELSRAEIKSVDIARLVEALAERDVERVLGHAVDDGVDVDALEEVARDGLWDAIGRGAFGDIKRTRTGGKGYAGVVERSNDYVNPILAALEAWS